MSTESSTKPIMFDCEETAERLIDEREFMRTMKFCKITLVALIFLTVLILPLVFCLGFILSELSYTARHQIGDTHLGGTACRPIEGMQYVEVFDTEQKIEDCYKTMQATLFPKRVFAKGEFPLAWTEQPLVAVGPFITVVEKNTGNFSVRDTQTYNHLVEMGIFGQTKMMRLHGLLERGQKYPRFFAVLTYSDDGIYKNGKVSLSDGEGTWINYIDEKGIGVFDTIEKSVTENEETVYYRLNGLTWERIDEPPLFFPGR